MTEPKNDAVSVPLGRTITTGGIAATMRQHPGLKKFVHDCITRHQSGDWGNVDEQDQQSNEAALANGEQILSVYDLPHPVAAATNFGDATVTKLWVISDSDRTVTTVLWPCEY